MDAQTSGFPRDDIRVADADRDQAVSELSEHFQTGRLTQDEFEDRSGRALQARTGRDLSELFTDLPPRTMATVPPSWAAGPGPGNGDMARAQRHYHVPVVRVVVAFFLLSTIAGHVFSPGQGGLGWLVPVVILGVIFLRMGARHRRR